MKNSAILLVSCPDAKGEVAAISDFVYRHGGNILHADEHADEESGLFLMRVEFDPKDLDIDLTEKSLVDFAKHFSMDMGVPYFFFQPSTSKTGATSTNGMGNPYLGLTYSAKGSALDFSTSLNSAIPTASTAKGLSTGHVTADWSNHLAHEFDLFTPFVDVGLANAIPDTRFLHRPYISYGDVAHFEGGSELDLGDKFSVTASGYYILPWGPQQIFLRGTKSSSGPTKGGVSLTRDDGINLGIDYNLTRSLDLSAGYSRSVYNVLNTFSFGIGVNVSSLLKRPSKE